MLTETENLEIVFHQNLITLTESADGEPDLYYFGISIGIPIKMELIFCT